MRSSVRSTASLASISPCHGTNLLTLHQTVESVPDAKAPHTHCPSTSMELSLLQRDGRKGKDKSKKLMGYIISNFPYENTGNMRPISITIHVKFLTILLMSPIQTYDESGCVATAHLLWSWCVEKLVAAALAVTLWTFITLYNRDQTKFYNNELDHKLKQQAKP